MKRLHGKFSKSPRALPLALLFLLSSGAQAQEFADVSPTSLELTLAQGETTVEQVSITINPFCVRPIDVDVVASDPGALVANQTGVVRNNCGGDTSLFDVSITGTGTAQSYDLQFVDSEFGGEQASIPVTISTPGPGPCSLDLALSLQRGTLNLDFTIGTPQPAQLNLYLSAYNSTASMLLAPVNLPVLDPPWSVRSTIPSFPDLDNFGILATLTTAEDGIICSSWQTFDSSPLR